MKHFRLKIVLAVVLSIVFVTAFGWIIAGQNYRKLAADALIEKSETREAVRFTLNNLTATWREYEKMIAERYVVDADFASLAFSNVGESEKDMAQEIHENGAVVSIEKGVLSAPEAVKKRLGLESSLLYGRNGYFAAPNELSTLVVYSSIARSTDYYVVWYENTVLQDVVEKSIDIPTILKRTESIYDMPAVFLLYDPAGGDVSGVLYKNDQLFEDCDTLEDLSLTLEDLVKSEKATGLLTFENNSYTYVVKKSLHPAGYVILLQPAPNLYYKALGQAAYMIAALIVTLVVLLVAAFSIYPYVENNTLLPEEEKNLRPSRVRSYAVLFGLYGIISIALCSIFGCALNGLYDNTARGKQRLDMIETSLLDYSKRYIQNNQTFRDVYQEYGIHIGQFLDHYPELRNSSVLTTLAERISASTITLFDSDGRETVSSGPWFGLELGKDPESSTYDFRRILKGAQSVIKTSEFYEQTGLTEMRLGVRIQDESSGGPYGVMLISMDVSALDELDTDPQTSIRGILQSLSDDDTNLWISDAKTGRILVSSEEALEGKSILEVGLEESDLKGALVKTLATENGTYFISSASMSTFGIPEWADAEEGVIVYFREPRTIDAPGMLRSCLTGCILFCVIYSILAFIVLTEYTEGYFNQAISDKKSKEERRAALGSIRGRLSSIPPGRMGFITLEFITAVILLLLIPITRSSAFSTQDSVFYHILSGEWEKGLNLFAVAGILLLLSQIVLLVIFARLLLAIFSSLSGSRGKTICRLIESVILYLSLFGLVIKTCEYLGFSREMIVTGVGALALTISLGAQDFVADVIAGLTFVFEGTVHVGDIVSVIEQGCPEFQGTVTEVGVRTIKVLSREGDLTATFTRNIKTIKNLTQMNSRVICKMTLSSAFSAEEIEQMLKAELPNIGRDDRRILRGPFYNGITKIEEGKITLSVSAECREKDYDYVRDKLNVFLQRVFREHGFKI